MVLSRPPAVTAAKQDRKTGERGARRRRAVVHSSAVVASMRKTYCRANDEIREVGAHLGERAPAVELEERPHILSRGPPASRRVTGDHTLPIVQ